MSMDVQQSLKMNSDFWPPRGPTSNSFQPMMDPTNDYHQHQRNQQHSASGFHNNNNNETNNGVVDMKDHLIAGQENQNSFNQSQSGFQINQQPAPVVSPGAESSSPESKFNADKFVNDIQVSPENPHQVSGQGLAPKNIFGPFDGNFQDFILAPSATEIRKIFSLSRRTFSPETLRRVGLVVAVHFYFLVLFSYSVDVRIPRLRLPLTAYFLPWKHRQSKDGLCTQAAAFFLCPAKRRCGWEKWKKICAVKDSSKKRMRWEME